MDKFEFAIVDRDMATTGIGPVLDKLNKLGEQGWSVATTLTPNMVGYEYIILQRKKKEEGTREQAT